MLVLNSTEVKDDLEQLILLPVPSLWWHNGLVSPYLALVLRTFSEVPAAAVKPELLAVLGINLTDEAVAA